MVSINKQLQRRKDGKEVPYWRVSYKDPAGKWRQKKFSTRRAAQDFASQVTAEIHAGIHVPDTETVTVEQACEIWLEACRLGRKGRAPVERTTLESYLQHARDYIVPALGAEKLTKLTKAHIMAFRDRLLAHDPIGRHTALKILKSLRMALDEAQSRGLVNQNHAASVHIYLDSREKTEIEVPSPVEVSAILCGAEALAMDRHPRTARGWLRFQTFLQIAVFTGLRMSEIRGLPREAVDLNVGNIEVRQRADRYGVIGPPKSRSGYRTVDIPARLADQISAYLAIWPTANLLFGAATGHPWRYENLRHQFWVPLVTAMLEKHYTLHALRHYYASRLIGSGADPKEIQAALGHANIQMTYDVYGHLFDDQRAVEQRKKRIESISDI